MKAATQERLRMAQTNIASGNIVFLMLRNSERERRVTSIGHSQHNIEACFDDGDHWAMFDPDELVGIRVVMKDG